MKIPRWLEWAREIQSLAQTGSYYAENEFQHQRYHRLMEIAAEIITEYSSIEYPSVVEAFSTPLGYATPRIDVRGAVFNGKKLLLVRELMDGGWTLPGGWADVGEIPSIAAEREVWEEAGFQVKAKKVIGVYDANRIGRLELFHAYKLVFLCDLIAGEAKTSAETTEVVFFERNEIPEQLSGERTKSRHIQDAYFCLDHPDCETFFD